MGFSLGQAFGPKLLSVKAFHNKPSGSGMRGWLKTWQFHSNVIDTTDRYHDLVSQPAIFL